MQARLQRTSLAYLPPKTVTIEERVGGGGGEGGGEGGEGGEGGGGGRGGGKQSSQPARVTKRSVDHLIGLLPSGTTPSGELLPQ